MVFYCTLYGCEIYKILYKKDFFNQIRLPIVTDFNCILDESGYLLFMISYQPVGVTYKNDILSRVLKRNHIKEHDRN